MDGRVTIRLAIMTHPYILPWHIVWNLTLVHIDPSAISIPDGLICIKMLHHKCVGDHIVSIDHKSVLRYVFIPCNLISVIRSPDPEVVADRIITVDGQTGMCLHRLIRLRSSYAEEQIR